MNRDEFDISLDMSLSKDRVKLCLKYINDLESRKCENCIYLVGDDICKYHSFNFRDICAVAGTDIFWIDKMQCENFKRRKI